MTVSIRLRDMQMRAQLMFAFALLSIAATAVTTATLTIVSSQRMHVALRERSQRVAERMQLQLQSVVEFDDRLTARELFDSYSGDPELDGIAVYAANGEVIEGRGNRPGQLQSIDEDFGVNRDHIVAVANIKTHGGGVGRLYISFSTHINDELVRRQVRLACGFGVTIALCALFLAVRWSRRIANRLVAIADAANRMARGDLRLVAIDDHAKDEIGDLAHSFNIMVSELTLVSRERDQLASAERAKLEELVSQRTYELEQSREMFRLMAESTRAIPFTLDLTRNCFTYIGAQGIAAAEIAESQWQEIGALEIIVSRESNHEVRQRFDECEAGPFEFVTPLTWPNGRRLEMRWTGTCEFAAGFKIMRGLMLDITELRRLGRELAAAQKLESIGRLAAGVAHEINTPVQFVSDNIQFVRASLLDIAAVIQAYRVLQQAVQSAGQSAGNVAEAARLAVDAEGAADIDYILQNVPQAIESSIEGVGRIATIVRAMKEFAHPDQEDKTLADLNQAIASTLVIANNEFKYIAELDTQYGPLPQIKCYLGEVNQVVLNLVINASHAIADVVKDSGVRGKLTVRTRLDGNEVEIAITDTGTGIPEAVRDKIFDPFFTTKEVGKGTGQGLALAHSVVVGKHGGTLRFETECGKGTTFLIRLPIDRVSKTVDAKRSAA
jgi:signal transduction histidine kinase/HAMP domain-containing protein